MYLTYLFPFRFVDVESLEKLNVFISFAAYDFCCCYFKSRNSNGLSLKLHMIQTSRTLLSRLSLIIGYEILKSGFFLTFPACF